MSNIAAWATFNGTSGQIISGCNIGSVTRLDQGQYKLCFSDPRPAVDYGIIASGQTAIGSSDPVVASIATGTQDTVLLLHFEGPNGSTAFIDSSNYINPVTPNVNAAISTTQSKFGTSSLYLDGSSYLTIPTQPYLWLDTADFTMDCWIYITGVGSGNQIFSSRVGGFDGLQWHLTPAGLLRFNVNNTTVVISAAAPSQNVWHHVAVTRSSGTVRMFIDGVMETPGTYTSSAPATTTTNYIGSLADLTEFFIGYIDEFRIIKGTALYTSNFTPPTVTSTVAGAMTRDCFYIQTAANGQPIDPAMVSVAAIAGCDSGSSGGGKCC